MGFLTRFHFAIILNNKSANYIAGESSLLHKKAYPTRETLRRMSEQAPEINVSAVEVLLQILQTAHEIHLQVYDILERQHKLSEGKLMVMMILYQSPEGAAPSTLAERAGVTRATISAMLRRMIRDGLARSLTDSTDGRRKLVALTEQGCLFLKEILPDHFMREAQLMNNVSEDERHILVRLLKKIRAH